MIYIVIAICFISGMIYGFFMTKFFSRKKKYFGDIVVTETNGITLFSLELKGDPEQILDNKEVTFKVVIPEEESDRE